MVYDKKQFNANKVYTEMCATIGCPNDFKGEFIIKCKDTFENTNNIIEKDTHLLVTGYVTNYNKPLITAKVANNNTEYLNTILLNVEDVTNHFKFVIEDTAELYNIREYNDVIDSLYESTDGVNKDIRTISLFFSGLCAPIGFAIWVVLAVLKLSNVVLPEELGYTDGIIIASIFTIIAAIFFIPFIIFNKKIETVDESIYNLRKYVETSERELLLGVYKPNAISISDDILTEYLEINK